MKIWNIKNSMVVLIALLCGVFTGCEPTNVEPTFNVSVSEVSSDRVTVTVDAQNCTEFAYIIATEAKDHYNSTLLFANGTVMPASGSTVIELDGLSAKTDYFGYFAAKVSDSEFFPEIKAVEFTTKDYEFDELITIVETYHDGYKVHFTLPQSTKDNKNAIRFNTSCIMMYNYVRDYLSNDDYASTLYNGGRFIVEDDQTWLMNNESSYYVDENGEYGNYFDPISPGQPQVIVAAEYSWMDGEQDATDTFGYPAGWEPGYYMPLLDPAYYGRKTSQNSVGVITDFDISSDMDKFWTGAFQKKVVRVKQPDLLDANVRVEVSDIGPVDATITIVPDDNVNQYAYAIMDGTTYNQMMELLDGREDLRQWAVTSYFGAYTLGCNVGSGAMQINLSDYFIEVPSESEIYVLLTAMGNNQATSQAFYETKFSTTAKVLDPPVVEVTALEEEKNPFLASFNIKAPNKDLKTGFWAANYKRDWMLAINAGDTYFNIVRQNFEFTEDELAKINSDEGLRVSFPTVDGETTRLVVVGLNAENTPNNLNYENIEDCPAVADCTTPYANYPPMVESTLYDDLVGDWTATATIQYSENIDGVNIKKTKEHKSKITISKDVYDYPQTLPSEVYDIYKAAGKNKSQTDDYFAEFKDLAEVFTENRIVNHNRLLCQGWIDYDSFGRFKTYSPYDLFVSKDYSSVDVASMFFDFGPKWFLQIAEGDKVSVPIDSNFLPPMSAWQGYPFYIAGYNIDTNYAFTQGEDSPAFPVTISADKNTITIEPITFDGKPYYPNAIGNNSGSTEIAAIIKSSIVLTRGWTETAAQNSVSLPEMTANRVNAVDTNGNPVELKDAVYKSLTEFKPISFKHVEGEVMTSEKLEENFRKLAETLTNQNK